MNLNYRKSKTRTTTRKGACRLDIRTLKGLTRRRIDWILTSGFLDLCGLFCGYVNNASPTQSVLTSWPDEQAVFGHRFSADRKVAPSGSTPWWCSSTELEYIPLWKQNKPVIRSRIEFQVSLEKMSPRLSHIGQKGIPWSWIMRRFFLHVYFQVQGTIKGIGILQKNSKFGFYKVQNHSRQAFASFERVLIKLLYIILAGLWKTNSAS